MRRIVIVLALFGCHYSMAQDLSNNSCKKYTRFRSHYICIDEFRTTRVDSNYVEDIALGMMSVEIIKIEPGGATEVTYFAPGRRMPSHEFHYTPSSKSSADTVYAPQDIKKREDFSIIECYPLVPDGRWMYWDKDGKPTRAEYYKDGKLEKTDKY